MTPQLPTAGNGVLLLGEALGAEEAEAGKPFVGRSGFTLTRLLGWAGLDRGAFGIANAVWCRPPNNQLEGQPWADAAIASCRERHWERLLSQFSVVVPLGNVATRALLGNGGGILKRRGYPAPVAGTTLHAVPTLHPSFIQRGQWKYAAAVVWDLQKAARLAAEGLAIHPTDYALDPSPADAWAWAQRELAIQAADPSLRLAFDIETPGKGEDEGEADEGEEHDRSYHIFRVGFALRSGVALSVPFDPVYYPAIRALLASPGEKVVWNGSFDIPRLKAAGFTINGVVHDGMVAWHVLHSDLPKGLGFVATFTCPEQGEWKSLSGRAPALYNAIDADVEARSMAVIEAELRASGLWEVYDRDIVRLEPMLAAMSTAGMPIDRERRAHYAQTLDTRLGEVRTALVGAIPFSARSWTPAQGYTKEPASTEGCVRITVEGRVKRCSVCGVASPTKPHFRTLKRPTKQKPQNPCAGGSVVESVELVERWARLDEWKPSRVALIRYQHALGRPIPHTFDKKTRTQKPTMNEEGIKKLMKQFPDDPVYPTVLRYRELDKLCGQYIGRWQHEDETRLRAKP